MGCTRRACAAPQSTSTRGCWRILTACGKGAVGGTFRTCCPTAHPHTPGLILSASDGIWNVLFWTCSHTSRWVRFRFGGCVSLVVAHEHVQLTSPFTNTMSCSSHFSQNGEAEEHPWRQCR